MVEKDFAICLAVFFLSYTTYCFAPLSNAIHDGRRYLVPPVFLTSDVMNALLRLGAIQPLFVVAYIWILLGWWQAGIGWIAAALIFPWFYVRIFGAAAGMTGVDDAPYPDRGFLFSLCEQCPLIAIGTMVIGNIVFIACIVLR